MTAPKAVRVLALGPTPPPYHGVATYLRDLLAAPPPPGFELLHLDTADRRDASNLGRWDPTNLQLGFANLSELAGRGLRSGIDIVYLPISQNVPAYLRDALFMLQSRLLGKRVVVHLHGGHFRALYEGESAWFRTVARATLQSAAAVIVLGDGFRKIFSGLVDERRIHVVENGVPDPGAWELRRAQPAHSAHGPRLLYMSTLTRSKGILELLHAFALLRRGRPAARLDVAGQWQEPDLQREAAEFIAGKGLSDAVHFAGNVDGAAKSAFLAGGDLFCLPTYYPYEGQPLVILEAMAAGLPVLATTHGVIASTVQNGVTGCLLPKEPNAAALAQALEDLLSNPGLLAEYGRAGRQRYLSHFTLTACHARLFNVFRQVAAE